MHRDGIRATNSILFLRPRCDCRQGNTAVPTNRSIRTIRDSLLRPVSIRLLHVVANF